VCQEEAKACPAKAEDATCPNGDTLKEEDKCDCSCDSGKVYDFESNTCIASVTCKVETCKPGTAQDDFDCECKPDVVACRKEYPYMKWDRELELCIPVEICDINCRPGFNKKDCECKTIYSENECNAQKGTMWDKNTKKCEAEKRCPAETCPDKSPMSPKNGCKCECEEGTSWDPEA